jgi:hypothetical protein
LQLEYESYLEQAKTKERRNRELDKQELDYYIDKLLENPHNFLNTRKTFDWRLIKNTFSLKVDTSKFIKTLADNKLKEKKVLL